MTPVQGNTKREDSITLNTKQSRQEEYNICVPQFFLFTTLPLAVGVYPSTFEFSPRTLQEYIQQRIGKLASNPAWMVLLHYRTIRGLEAADKKSCRKGVMNPPTYTEKANFNSIRWFLNI